ncbi:MAG: thiolase family protein [Deltaproteobacteria bacterium]|nr:thiolase family protein [Deltaproteobacteria bacterium]
MKHDDDVVFVSAVRSAFSRFGGALRHMHSMDIAVQVMNGVLDRVELDKTMVEIIYYGMCIQSEAAIESNVNGRQAMLRAGFPPEILSLTVDRACCSSLTAVHLCYKDILLREADIAMAVGTENMSNTPFVLNNVRWASGLEQPKIKDHLFPITYTGFNHLALDAGEVALEYGVSREEQDQWACRSQMRYQEAKSQGKFKDEIIPLDVPQSKGDPVVFDEDEFPKPNTTMEALSRLKTVYGSPTVSGGNAPGLDAGASALLLMRRKNAQELGIPPLARIVSIASVALEPRYIAAAPAPAIRKALGKADLTLDDMDRIEINEAFAAMPLVATKILADGSPKKIRELREKTNVNGGAVAIGHPVGASGGRILTTLIYELRRIGGRYGVCAICGGLAQGDAAVVEEGDAAVVEVE